MNISLKVNSKDFLDSANKLQRNIERKAIVATTKAAECLVAETQRLVPRETGTLASTCRVSTGNTNGASNTVVSYGLVDAYNPVSDAMVSEYLLKVVEDPDTGVDFMGKAIANKEDEIIKIFNDTIGGAFNS